MEKDREQDRILAATNAFFVMRAAIMEQINSLWLAFGKDGDEAKTKLLKSLNRTANDLKRRFEMAGLGIDPKRCAAILYEREKSNNGNPLAKCRYYKGEKSNNFDGDGTNKNLFWGYEKLWIERYRNDSQWAQNDLMDYIAMGLMDFNADDGTPITLKTLLFNRFCHWEYVPTAEGFKRFYIQSYLNQVY